MATMKNCKKGPGMANEEIPVEAQMALDDLSRRERLQRVALFRVTRVPPLLMLLLSLAVPSALCVLFAIEPAWAFIPCAILFSSYEVVWLLENRLEADQALRDLDD